jgi:uncharacterized protein YjbI with pentapeptide repeats
MNGNGLTQLNRWILIAAGGHLHPGNDQVVNIWYNQDSTVYGVNPTPGAQAPGDANIVTVYMQDEEEGAGPFITLQCGGGYNAFATAMFSDDVSQGGPVAFQYSDGSWATQPSESFSYFTATPTGDGYFILGRPEEGWYLTVDSAPAPAAGNCYPLRATMTGDTRVAARFTAIGLDAPVALTFLTLGPYDAQGLSFQGADLSRIGNNVPFGNMSGCDFRHATISSGSSLGDANLHGASFAGQNLEWLDIQRANCTGADFSGCGFMASPNSPVLNGADLTGAAIPEGRSWAGTNMPDVVLAEATLWSSNLSGADLSGANLSGNGVTLFSPIYQSDAGIGGYTLSDAADQIIAFDYNSTGKLDHLVCYRPGAQMISIIEKKVDAQNNVTFDTAWASTDGIGNYDLKNAADRIIAFDYNSSGNLDHLVCYRPGHGAFWIIEKQAAGGDSVTFVPLVHSGSGIGPSGPDGCSLMGAEDRIIAYDFYGTGHLDHLLCYRPGGDVWIFEKDTDPNNNVVFNPVFTSTQGIGGYDLGSLTDQIIAYADTGAATVDGLVCYRPGGGSIFILRKTADANKDVAFDSVYVQGYPGDGIAGYNLLSTADRIIAFDYAGTGIVDHLLCYRPGIGAVCIVHKHVDDNNNVTFNPVYRRLGIGGYDLVDSRDQMIAYDYSGSGKLDHLVCYRPGTGQVSIIASRPARPAIVDYLNLTDCTLAGTDFTGMDVTKVVFSSPLKRSDDPAKPTIFARSTVPFGVIGLDWSYLDLTSATIVGLPSDLTGLVAVAVRLPDFKFTCFVLDGANFANATLDGVHFEQAKIRPGPGAQTPSFAGAKLVGAYFNNAVLDQVSFSGATMGGAQEAQAADFSSAWISNCDFSGANAYAVHFSGATLVSGNFDNAYLPYASFNGASLQGATFDGACMIECDLTNAWLTPAEKGAKSASLDSACLQAAVFTGTKLGGASLENAAVTDQDGQIEVTHYDEDGSLIGPEPISWRGRSFPTADSFSDATTCPNGDTYGDNVQDNQTIAQMMQAQNPPTQWKPVGVHRLTGAGAGSSRADVAGRPDR